MNWHSKDRKYGGVITVINGDRVLELYPDSQLTLIKENRERIRREASQRSEGRPLNS